MPEEITNNKDLEATAANLRVPNRLMDICMPEIEEIEEQVPGNILENDGLIPVEEFDDQTSEDTTTTTTATNITIPTTTTTTTPAPTTGLEVTTTTTAPEVTTTTTIPTTNQTYPKTDY